MIRMLRRCAPAWYLLAAVTICLVPQCSKADADLQSILDRWAEALGGRERLTASPVVEQHVTGTAFGLDASVRSWTALDGRVRLEIDLGSGLYTFLQVFDGERAWQVDQNGKRSALEGVELKSLISSAYVDRHVQLWDASRGSIELLEPEDGHARVRCVPDGGEPVTFVLDAETGRPLRYETPAQERVQVTTLHGWTERNGIQFPAAFDQSRGDPQYDANFELKDVVFHDEVDAAWFTAPDEGASDVFFTQASPVRDIPIELNTTHVFVQCSVNGSPPLWFILDTGASITVLSRTTAMQLGLELQGSIEGRGSGEGTTEVQLAGNVTYGVPGVELRGQTVATIDLDSIEAKMGRELDGILGYDFISRFVVEIDYAGRRLHLYEREGWTYEGKGQEVSVSLEGSQPHVQAELVLPGREPVTGLFLIDTGANGAVHVSRPFDETHDLVGALEKSVEFSGGFGVGGRSKSILGRVPELRLGGLRFTQPVTAFSRDERGAHADPNVAGLIGGHVLKRCRVIFDYERKRMFLEPGPGMDEPFGVDSLGMIGTTGGRSDFHRFTILDTIANSPAAQAGLREGDEILVFDGIPAAELTVHSMWERVQEATDRIVLRIRRGGDEMDVEVQLRPLI